MDKKKQIISVIIIVVLVSATIGLLLWSKSPVAIDDSELGAVKKERKLPASLLSDPRFQALKSSGGEVEVGTKGNPNPFEPFSVEIKRVSGGVKLEPTDSFPASVDIKLETDVEIKSSCGDSKCFEEKFKQCKPATMTVSAFEGVIFYYEIIGPKDGRCEVKSKFIANPNPDWVGKEMTCRYDNTKKFDIAVEQASKEKNNCQGLLAPLLKGE